MTRVREAKNLAPFLVTLILAQKRSNFQSEGFDPGGRGNASRLVHIGESAEIYFVLHGELGS